MYNRVSLFKQLVLVACPTILYVIPYFGKSGFIAAAVILSPLWILIGTSLPKFKSINFKTYGLLYLYIFSQMFYAYRNGFLQGIVVPITLLLFLHAATDFGGASLTAMKKISQCLLTGLITLFFCCIFFPLILKFPYTPKAWYYVASAEIPIISTTMDGPFLIAVLVAMLFLSFTDVRKKVPTIAMYFFAAAAAFYTLMVFNRRMILLVFVLLIPIVFFKLYGKRWVYRALLLISFLVPFNFIVVLNYAGEVSKSGVVADVMQRTEDLNEKNSRLTGWVLALKSFSDISYEDFFGYRKVLVRSDEDRYNHFHNGFIQMYYEQGMFGFTVLVLLLLQLCRRIKSYEQLNLHNNVTFYLFPVILALILFLSNTESTYRRLSIFHISYVIAAFMILRTTDELERQRRGIRMVVETVDDEPEPLPADRTALGA